MAEPLEVERIIKGLTKAQREALTHENAGKCAYRWARMGTLDALRQRGLIGCRPGPGSFSSPQTGIKWPITETGLAVRAALLEQSE